MYIFFDLNKVDCYKTDNLQVLKNFANRNINADFDWQEVEQLGRVGAATNVSFSDCGKFSIEKSKADIKGIHLIPTIADGTKLD